MFFSHSTQAQSLPESAHEFVFESLTEDKKLPLSNFKGNVVLIVNTASECGFTPQYKELEELYQLYKDKGLIIVGVPSNDFGKQEPGSNEEVAEFCQKNFGVTFPMTKKEVVSGKDAHPFYQWAKSKLTKPLSAPKWNFHKYLLDQEGHLVDFFASTTKPMSSKVKKAIEELLVKPQEEVLKTDPS